MGRSLNKVKTIIKKKLNAKAKKSLYKDAEDGKFIHTIAAIFKDDETLARKYFSDKPFIPLSECQKLLTDAQKLLQSVAIKECVVMVERQPVIDLVLTLGALHDNYLLPELDNEVVVAVRNRAKEFFTASNQVKSILEKTTKNDVYFEDFRKEIDETTYPNVSLEVLNLIAKHALTVYSDFGVIDLNLDPDVPTELSCKVPYRITASFRGGFSDHEKIAFIQVEDVYGDGPSLLIKGALYKLAVDVPEFRMPVLNAQAVNRSLEIDVRIARMSIFPKSKVLPQLALVNIVSSGDEVSKMQDQIRLNFGG
jgi:hypothetical protein